ncbi:hypothetical protein [Caenibacillus caldisaponilyticus]|uniref:hypothetical protein n=1 Tax=Caenibacillus caldisaponilyticus TaxID=1674942 RepID=UPI000988480A|nr:hypothetical protein [Caenibacillus caldisaponilyticus]
MSKNNIYAIEIIGSRDYHAGSKARNDISLFLSEMGIPKIFFDREVGRLEKLIFLKHNIKRKLSKLNNKDIIIIQYPLPWKKYFTNFLIKMIKLKRLFTVVIIHDLESIRYSTNPKSVNEEIRNLNKFDVIISHNAKMTTFLKQSGVERKIIDLEIFDYYNPNPIKRVNNNKNQIIFAGNLNKARFISKLRNLKNELLLFGPNPQVYHSNNIKYMGSFPPDELPLFLEGTYGLVWDGEAINSCVGLFGEYLRYNNPHKTSLYLSSGLPVIIWKDAALAEFIKNNNLGLLLSDLGKLDEEIEKVSNKEYELMRNNALEIARKIRNGYFIKTAIQKAKSFLLEDK